MIKLQINIQKIYQPQEDVTIYDVKEVFIKNENGEMEKVIPWENPPYADVKLIPFKSKESR